MGLKVHKSELNSSTIQSLLANEAQDAAALITAINNFVNDTSQSLQGEAYDAARSEMIAYAQILERRVSAASELATAVANSTSSLSNYMGSYDYLDDSDISELKQEILNIQEYYENIIESYKQRSFLQRLFFSETKIRRECAAKIAPLQEELTKLEGLAGADSAAYSLLTAATSTVEAYRTSVTSK